jgi:integrase
MSRRLFRSPRAGGAPPSPRALPTVKEWLRAWVEGRLSLRPSTQISYRGHIERYLCPHLGHLPLDALRPSDIHAMNRELVQQHGRSTLSPATIRRIHATLHAALEAAVREDLIAKNPATGIELPTRPHQEPTTWTLEQAIAFLRGLDDADPVHLMFRVMLLRGLRRGETLGLTWADVDFVKRRLRISCVQQSGVRVPVSVLLPT